MFDIGISELGLIGVVALVVIGPERLPKVARTVGTLLGRARTYVSDVKAEVSREMQLDELRKMKENVQQAAHEVENTIHKELKNTESEINSALLSDETGSSTVLVREASGVSPAKRKNWHRNRVAKQSAMPRWYRASNRKRSRVLSGAARVARFRPK